MVNAGIIELNSLEVQFQEILPRLATFSLRTDPEGFVMNFKLFKQRLGE
jgi:hypothetical protein